MRHMPLLILLAAGCGSASDRLIGEWVFDVATLDFSPSFRNADAKTQENTIARSRFNLKFTKDKLSWDHAFYGYGSEKWEAPYKVVAEEGNRVTIEVEGAFKKKKKFVLTVKKDRLRFSMQGRPILLKPKPKDE